MTGPEPVTPPTQPLPDNLTARVFRALYRDFKLHTIAGTHIAVPKVTPCFTLSSLGEIVRQSAATSITLDRTCTKCHPPECS